MIRSCSDTRERGTAGIEQLLARLEGVVERGYGQYLARCPAHDDHDPSLSIKVLDDGRVLLHCFAGCAVESILMALRLEWSDLFPAGARALSATTTRWNYHDLSVMARRELQVAIVAVSDVLAGKQLCAADLTRLTLAHERLTKLLELSGD